MQAVLEYSLRKHATEPVEITWMKLGREGPFAGWDTSQFATPFTAFRWAVPELCGFTGRALYVDVDFLFLADVTALVNQPIPDGKIGLVKDGGSRTCIIVWDCEAARPYMWSMDQLKRAPHAHNALRSATRSLFAPFDGAWNCLDGESLAISAIKAVHLTAMRHQPHLERANARLAKVGRRHWFDGTPERHWREDLIELFERTLAEAEANGYGVERYCREPIFGGYQKRSLARIGRPSWAGAAPC